MIPLTDAHRRATKADSPPRVVRRNVQPVTGRVMDRQEMREVLADLVNNPKTIVKDVIAAIRADNKLAGDGQ